MEELCERYDATTLQQLTKIVTDENGEHKEKNVYPISILQAIFDGVTGTRLDHILSFSNCIYVPFKGNREATRLTIGAQMRRNGLIISFKDLDSVTHTQRYTYKNSIADEYWKADANWEDCFVGFNDLDFVNELKQYITEYVDEKLKSVLPPEGYEFVIAKKSEILPEGYEYVVYEDDNGELVKVYSTNKEPIIRKIIKE